jgi:hypothetical protein
VSTLHVITVCFSFNSVLSKTQRGCRLCPGPVVPVLARFRLAAAARAGAVRIMRRTKSQSEKGSAERQSAAPGPCRVRTFDPFLLSLAGAVLSVAPPLVDIARRGAVLSVAPPLVDFAP